MHLLNPVLLVLATGLPFVTQINARAVPLDLALNAPEASGPALTGGSSHVRRLKLPDFGASPHVDPVGPSGEPLSGAGIEGSESGVPGSNPVLNPETAGGSGPAADSPLKGSSPPKTEPEQVQDPTSPGAPKDTKPAPTKPIGPAPKAAPGSEPKSDPESTKCKRADDIQNAICQAQQKQDEVFNAKFGKGQTMQAELADAYKGSRTPPKWMSLDDKYTVERRSDGALPSSDYEPSTKVLNAIGVKVAESKWQAVYIRSKVINPKENGPVVIQAMSPTKETIVIAQRYSSRDGNRVGKTNTLGKDYLPVSELTWQAWDREALGSSGKLRYITTQNIVNQETTDVLEASRRLVAALPKSQAETDYDRASLLPPGPLRKHSPQYRIFSASEDADPSMAKAFTGLLGTDNVRPIANMVADHQQGLTLKKITKIHAFYDTLWKGDYQMIVELA